MEPLPLATHGPKGAPPVLFLHGFMGAGARWQRDGAGHSVARRLDGCVRCLAVDLPGHGAATGRPAADYTMAGCAEALAATLRAAGVRRPATVVGYSMGGRLALYFALEYPERCRALVLESASPGLETEAERAARRRTDAERARRIEADFPAFLEDWYRMALFASLAARGLVRETIRARLANEPSELARSLAGMGTGQQPSLWARLPELRMPALVLAGVLDEKYRRLTEEMASRGRLRRLLVPHAGHNIHAERPRRFATILRAFLNGVPEWRS